MSKSRLVWEAMKRDAEREILGEKARRKGSWSREDAEEQLRELTLDARVDLAGMAAVFLLEES